MDLPHTCWQPDAANPCAARKTSHHHRSVWCLQRCSGKNVAHGPPNTILISLLNFFASIAASKAENLFALRTEKATMPGFSSLSRSFR